MANRMYLTPETLQCALHTAQCTLQSAKCRVQYQYQRWYSTSTSATVLITKFRYTGII